MRKESLPQREKALKNAKSVPQRLKPAIAISIYGTAEAVPFLDRLPHTQSLKRLRPVKVVL
jgi:hypothetical protein